MFVISVFVKIHSDMRNIVYFSGDVLGIIRAAGI